MPPAIAGARNPGSCAAMRLTLSTPHRPATDLGYLLMKNSATSTQ